MLQGYIMSYRKNTVQHALVRRESPEGSEPGSIDIEIAVTVLASKLSREVPLSIHVC